MSKEWPKGENKVEKGIDPAQEAMNKHLGSMEVRESRTLGIEDFRNLMHAIHAEFNAAKEEKSGTIEGGGEKFTYSCEDSDCKVIRVE